MTFTLGLEILVTGTPSLLPNRDRQSAALGSMASLTPKAPIGCCGKGFPSMLGS